ncbi:MAG: hypothetical protein K2K25_07920 [Muribaculaceae bacterium]|nr:hypothetical protein [Muribaculaceae bacterium]
MKPLKWIIGKVGKEHLFQEEKERLIEELILASMFLENIFLEYNGCHIYTSNWALYH